MTVKAGQDDNADDESETLTHTASGGDYAGVTKDLPATVTDDAPETVTVSFGAASYTVAEGSSRTVTVSLDEDPERTVVIPIEAANEGGASDSDYTRRARERHFRGRRHLQDLRRLRHRGQPRRGRREGEALLRRPSQPTRRRAHPGETTVSIHDRTQGQDLPTPPTVHFENAAYAGETRAPHLAVKVKLSKAPGSEVVIPISRANRAGATDPDYSGVPDTLTFGATDTEKTITFAATDDEVDDDGEKVELSFGTLPGGITATSGEAAEATVAITDDDDAHRQGHRQRHRPAGQSPTTEGSSLSGRTHLIGEDRTPRRATRSVTWPPQPSDTVIVTISRTRRQTDLKDRHRRRC